MEGYLWLYIWALAALPWWWRIKQHSCLFPEWCSAVLPNTTASLNLNVRSSSADAQDKANQHHMPRGWTLLPGPGVSHPHRPINQLQTAQFNPNHSSPCTDLLTLTLTNKYTHSLQLLWCIEQGGLPWRYTYQIAVHIMHVLCYSKRKEVVSKEGGNTGVGYWMLTPNFCHRTPICCDIYEVW